MSNTKQLISWYERYGYEYSMRWVRVVGEWDVQLFVTDEESISFRADSESEAHSRVVEEIIAWEQCGF